MRIFYLDENLKNVSTAGFKAPSDIATICSRLGFERIEMPHIRYFKNKVLYKIETFNQFTRFWIKLVLTLPKDSVFIYQHPTLGKRIAPFYLKLLSKKKDRIVIGMIHDIESLRGGVAGLMSVSKKYEAKELRLLGDMDYIICHNDKMKAYLVSNSIDGEKIVSLRIFDYLTECEMNTTECDKNTICIAGNLAPGKAGYIYELFDSQSKVNIKANLYGGYFQDCDNSNMMYKGSFKSDVVPGVLEGRFGLVWDGNTASTCAGNTGEYLRYNNPHKTSLYLASGIPVIVWSHAAIADFVLENNVGITVESLYEIEDKLNQLSDIDYSGMKENAIKLSGKLRSGYYFESAIKAILDRIVT